jgi:hypothetical protein
LGSFEASATEGRTIHVLFLAKKKKTSWNQPVVEHRGVETGSLWFVCMAQKTATEARGLGGN